MEITSGVINSAQKVVIYGPEGIGKSTLAAAFPKPLFIDTEGSTKRLNVSRLSKPSSWTMLKQEVEYVRTHPDICDTLIIDTADWAERLCGEHLCNIGGKTSIEGFNYGNGFTMLWEEFGTLLDFLTELTEVNINVVLTAHAQIIRFEQPDEVGSYDRWELKLGIKKSEKRTAAMVKEWADMVLFVNYKNYVYATDDKGKRHKASGGARIIHTTHSPCWDAKNRVSLPEELPLAYESIAHCIPSKSQMGTAAPSIPISTPAVTQPAAVIPAEIDTYVDDEPPEVVSIPSQPATEKSYDIPSGIPKELADLMSVNHVSEADIRTVVAQSGYFPLDTPISNYGNDFILGCLVGAWDTVFAKIKDINELPFN